MADVNRMSAYYNEIDPFAAAWLRELIKAGLIADGEVDERSITAVRPDDLRGFVQCHFFAGIGGWSHALRLAGWPDDRPVWTGSCPCQPWSVAGHSKGADDPRHLWPSWFSLIEQRRPPTVFGEQVASHDGLYWLDLVYVALESASYAVGTVDLAAASVGTPHRRQRLWFVADAAEKRRVCCDVVSNQHGTQGAGGTSSEWGKDWEVPQIRQTHGTISNQWDAEPSPIMLADGVSDDVDELRAMLGCFGNAIVPQVAAVFIGAYLATDGNTPRAV